MAKNTKKSAHREDYAGTITEVKGKNGLLMGRVQLGYNDDGKPNRKTFYGHSQKEVSDKIRTFVYKHRAGEYYSSSPMTVKEWMSIWLETYKKDIVREKTYEVYEQMVNCHINPEIGQIALKDLSNMQIQKFINLKNSQLSSASVRKIFFILKPALEKAVSNKMIPSNPAEDIALPKLVETEARYFTIEEEDLFLEKAKNDLLYPLFVLSIDSGLRIGELLALNWGDIDFQKQVVRVNKTVTTVKDYDNITPNNNITKIQPMPKTKKSIREVTLTDRVIGVLKAHKQKSMNILVFPTSKGTLTSPRNAERSFTRIAKKAGLENCNTHTARHTFASRLFQMGVDVKIVSELLGHDDVAITYKIYIHVIPLSKSEAVKKLDMIRAVKQKVSTPSVHHQE